jgi:hypothetical protein
MSNDAAYKFNTGLNAGTWAAVILLSDETLANGADVNTTTIDLGESVVTQYVHLYMAFDTEVTLSVAMSVFFSPDGATWFPAPELDMAISNEEAFVSVRACRYIYINVANTSKQESSVSVFLNAGWYA